MFEINAQLHDNLMKTATGFYGILKDSSDLESIFDIGDGLRNSDAMKASVDYLKSDSGVAQLIEENYIAPAPDLESLNNLPNNTLGYAYASSMIAAGFDPGFYRKMSPKNEIDYIVLRARQTHDIWHIVTGFTTDIFGEIGLQAFTFAQTHFPSTIIIMMSSLVGGVKNPENLDPMLQMIYQGYEAGKNARMFLAQKWEEGWDRPLNELRRELNVISAGQKL